VQHCVWMEAPESARQSTLSATSRRMRVQAPQTVGHPARSWMPLRSKCRSQATLWAPKSNKRLRCLEYLQERDMVAHAEGDAGKRWASRNGPDSLGRDATMPSGCPGSWRAFRNTRPHTDMACAADFRKIFGFISGYSPPHISYLRRGLLAVRGHNGGNAPAATTARTLLTALTGYRHAKSETS
jgi:hypothetical protein